MPTPAIHVSAAARQAVLDALGEATEQALRIAISDAGQYELRLDDPADGDVVVDVDGLRILLDADSAARADGLTLDYSEAGGQSGFSIGRPGAPAIRQLAAGELKAMMDRGDEFVLVDVRTEQERAIAALPGSRLLDRDTQAYLLALDRDTTIVFHCHHGIRSQAAAEYFLQEGFRHLHNLAGGIDAWSLDVDPDVPRY